ncbi:MAG: cyclic nucleotide-binding domain-containing protein [Rhodospirillales bacterium]
MADTDIQRKTFKAGERVFREGEAGDNAYIVESGQIEISKKVGEDELAVVAVVGKGALIGEMALIDNEPRAATARVVKPAVLLVIGQDDLNERMKRSDPIVSRLLKVLTVRLRSETRKAANFKTIVR